MITGMQIRAARVLLAWSQARLAEASGVSLPTVKRLEAAGNAVTGAARTNEKLRLALEAAGVVFIDDDAQGGRGVRLTA